MRRTLLFFYIFLNLSAYINSQTPGSTLSCVAAFSYVQDTSNKLIVNFTNESVGLITDYFWNFGDGSVFHGENPSHAFPYPDVFTVCLTVTNTDTIHPCLDSVCVTINLTPLPVFRLGGLLYAGNFPINNPHNTGDFGFSYLYRYENMGLVPVDTVLFDSLGYFWFPAVTQGAYCLKAGLRGPSSRALEFLPAYYRNNLFWDEADTIWLNSDIYNADIRMLPGREITAGSGSIHGRILMRETPVNTTPIPEGQVILADQEGNPYFCLYSDASGVFQFDQIPYGSYQVFGEYTGKYSQKIDLILDVQTPSVDSLEIQISSSVSAIPAHDTYAPLSVKCYPNPVSDILNIQYDVQKPVQFTLSLSDPLGKEMALGSHKYSAGHFFEILDISELHPGVYTLFIRGLDTPWVSVKKVIKM